MVDLSPHGSGQLTDPDGCVWKLRRRRLDVRTVRSMFKHADLPVLVGGGCPFLRWLPDEERASFAEEVRRCYGLPLNRSSCATQYVGHEFMGEDGRRMLYIETWC